MSLEEALGGSGARGFYHAPDPSDSEIAAAVADDPDAAPILTADELRRRIDAERARDPHGVARRRRRLGLSQEAFARRFSVPLTTPRRWEQGLRRPSEPARLLLELVADAPAAVEQAAARVTG